MARIYMAPDEEGRSAPLTESQRRVDEIMRSIPESARWSQWCPDPDNQRDCIGCCCVAAHIRGRITRAMWEAWFKRNDRRGPYLGRRIGEQQRRKRTRKDGA